MTWERFPHYCPFVRGNHWWVSPHKRARNAALCWFVDVSLNLWFNTLWRSCHTTIMSASITHDIPQCTPKIRCFVQMASIKLQLFDRRWYFTRPRSTLPCERITINPRPNLMSRTDSPDISTSCRVLPGLFAMIWKEWMDKWKMWFMVMITMTNIDMKWILIMFNDHN